MHNCATGDILMNKINDFTDLQKYDPREDIGYTKTPRIPWSHEVMRNFSKPSPPESPLKLAWLAQKERERNQKP